MALAADSPRKFSNQGALDQLLGGGGDTPRASKKGFEDIKAKLLQPSLTSQFVVTITQPKGDDWAQVKSDAKLTGYDQETLNLLCSETVLPGSSLATHTITSDHTGVTEQHAYRRVFDNKIDFTFMVPGGADAYLPIKYFEAWIKYIAAEKDEEASDQNEQAYSVRNPSYSYRMRYPEDYYAQAIKVQKFEKDKSGASMTYNFVNCYPTSVISMPVSYDASQILKCTVSMSYIRYYIESVKGERKTADAQGKKQGQNKDLPEKIQPQKVGENWAYDQWRRRRGRDLTGANDLSRSIQSGLA